ncbi:MAG: hypothetical protein AAB353_07540, partial [Candidatus Hydrogenedentota bacterium]
AFLGVTPPLAVPGLEGYTNTGLTVVVPEPVGDLTPIFLCVAVRMPASFAGWGTDGVDNDGDLDIDAADPDELALIANRLAVNFFDFSQEPDHEWIELVNLDKSFDPINLSGWELEVGYGPGDPNRRVLTIPGDPNAAYGDPDRPATFIEPGGMLLLATNKFDEFLNPNLPENVDHQNIGRVLYRNGIGLARGGADYATVTSPQIGTLGDNVFDRPALLDFVDTDGDGAEDAAGMRSEDDYYSSGDVTGSANGDFQERTKAWDRIVELVSADMANATGAPDVANFVLRGGVFPNYPESDGIDNDGDNAVLTTDLIDNDGDNLLLNGIDEFGEGVDEGRWMRDNAEAALGAQQVNDFFAVPGGFGFLPTFYAANVPAFPPTLETEVVANTGQIDSLYLASFRDPPDWKEFIERRFFPGDDVIVTLYEGRASGGRVADRVTYTQRDVENRQIDELIPSPYLDGAEVVSLQGDGQPSSFWPDNAMALDFYRSLERKHPLYNGDRFGTTNRWEATDGNYDDWAPSTGYYDAVFDAFTVVATPTGVPRTSPLFTHAFSGSPLRMNLSQRLIDNPRTTLLGTHQFPALPTGQASWRSEFAQVPARGTKSTGSMAQTPHFALTVDMSPNTGGGTIDANLNPLDAYSPVVNLLLRVPEVLAGDGVQDGLRAIMDGGSFDTLTLTAAQADFEAQFRPVPPEQDLPEQNDIATWLNGPPLSWAPVFLFDLPGALGRPETFNYKYQFFPPVGPNQSEWISIGAINAMVYLFSGDALQLQPAFSQGISPADLTERWSVFEPGFGDGQVEQMAQPRVAFYAAANRADVVSQAAATFEWDGADGLENGEYDVYIATVENLEVLQDTRLLAAGMLTDFAVSPAFTSKVGSGADKRPTSYAVDVEVFTDRNADGGVNTDTASPDSFGFQEGVTPSDDGIVHYGIVRVEGNQLVVGLRNRGVSGALNRFSRVILAPRQKTRGRININTAETKPIPSDQDQYASIPNDLVDPDLFNPLAGLPGILSRFQFSIGSTSQIFFPGDTAVPTSSAAAGSIAANGIDRTSGSGNDDIFYRAREIVLGRPDHYDGRYYE